MSFPHPRSAPHLRNASQQYYQQNPISWLDVLPQFLPDHDAEKQKRTAANERRAWIHAFNQKHTMRRKQ